jgi:hypothetical protein
MNHPEGGGDGRPEQPDGEAPSSAYEGRSEAAGEVEPGTRSGRGTMAPTGVGQGPASSDNAEEARHEGGGAAKERNSGG